MSTRERPLVPFSKGKNSLRLSELNRMADAVERLSSIKGDGVSTGVTGTDIIGKAPDWFWAKVTAKDSSSPKKYSWTLVYPDGDGGWVEPPGGPSGTASILPAYEANGADMDVTSPVYVKMFIRTASMMFEDPKGGATGGISGLAFKEQDGSPSYTTTTTVEVNQADGLVLTQPSAGTVLISIADASESSPGIMTTGNQRFAGRKYFDSDFRYLGRDTGTGDYYLSEETNYGGIPGYYQFISDASTSTPIGEHHLKLVSGGFYHILICNTSAGGYAVKRSGDGSILYGSAHTSSFGGVYVGGLLVTPPSSYDLEDLDDVDITTPSNGDVLTWNGSEWENAAPSGGGSGTVTSIDVDGGTTGLTSSGGPITSSGTLTLGGTLAIGHGGTGQTTANAALNALLPNQSGNAGLALLTDGTDTSWGTMTFPGYDLVSDLASSEISITSATTATISRMHVISGTSSDYTVTLPAVSGNAGKFIGFRIDPTSTKLFTLDGNGSEVIDGATTRVMWAGESALLECDGTAWFKVAGKTIAMVGKAANNKSLGSFDSIAHATVTTVELDRSDEDNTGMMVDLANDRITCRRSGEYITCGFVQIVGSAGGAGLSANATRIFASFPGAQPDASALAGSTPAVGSATQHPLTAGSHYQLTAYQTTGVTQYIYGGVTNLALIEIPQW